MTDNQGSLEQTIPEGSTAAEHTRTYYPYGKVRSGGQPDTDRTWIGQIEDDSTSLQYLNARYYDPTTAVFVGPDPVYDEDRPKTLNTYGYGMGSPTTFSDPSGLDIPCFHPGVRCPTEHQADLVATQATIGCPECNYNSLYQEALDLAFENEPGDTDIEEAGFPFWQYIMMHREVQYEVAFQVGGNLECFIPGGGRNGGPGFADVCARGAGGTVELWEVKYFGPSAENAQAQLQRYIDKQAKGVAGHMLSPGMTPGGIFYFSPAPGIVYYVPHRWFPRLHADPNRGPVLARHQAEYIEVLKEQAWDNGTGWSPLEGFQSPDLPGWVAPVAACIMFCIPTPVPVL